MTPSAPATERLFFLDWLRILAFAALVVYHVGMYYVSWDFHVKSPQAGPGLEPWMKLSEPWRMSLLFMVSGAATAHWLKAGPSFALVRRRSAYLMAPLLMGVVFIVPPQSYFEVVQKFGFTGDFGAFLRLYFTGYAGFCSAGQCLILPTWNHLWFLPYLWVYTLLMCALVAFWPTAWVTTTRRLGLADNGFGLLLWPALLLFLARLALFARFPSTHALWGDWFNHTVYFAMFALGAVFATQPAVWARLAALRRPALALAVVFWAVLVFLRPARPAEHAVVAIYQWSALVAAFGFAKVHLNLDSRIRKRLTEAVFPVYVLHQTVIIVASQWLLMFHLAPLVEGPILVVAAFVVSYAGYEIVRRFRVLRPWFGLKPVEP